MFEKLKKKEYFQFGKVIPDLKIHGKPAPYPVLNERAIRATAGLMLAAAVFGFSNAYFAQNYIYLKIIVITFFIDFLIKVTIGPTLAPYSILGRLIVKKQRPEWVGAIQKRFAWGIGFLMATIMLIVFVFMDIRGTIPIIFCSICMLFMWLETSFGICVGCKIYWFLVNHKIIKEPDYAPACPGGVCSIKK